MNQLAYDIRNKRLKNVLESRVKRITKGALIGGGTGLLTGIMFGKHKSFLTLIGLFVGIMVITSIDNGEKRESTMEGK